MGICKACGKGVCVECAVDLDKGLACRSKCEASAAAIIQLVDRNIDLSTAITQVQVSAPPPVQRSALDDYFAAQLNGHIRETLSFRRGFSVFCSIVGLLVIGAGLSEQSLVVSAVGACFFLFGILSFDQARRSARQPRFPQTQTR